MVARFSRNCRHTCLNSDPNSISATCLSILSLHSWVVRAPFRFALAVASRCKWAGGTAKTSRLVQAFRALTAPPMRFVFAGGHYLTTTHNYFVNLSKFSAPCIGRASERASESVGRPVHIQRARAGITNHPLRRHICQPTCNELFWHYSRFPLPSLPDLALRPQTRSRRAPRFDPPSLLL